MKFEHVVTAPENRQWGGLMQIVSFMPPPLKETHPRYAHPVRAHPFSPGGLPIVYGKRRHERQDSDHEYRAPNQVHRTAHPGHWYRNL
nr:hypothetical protein [Dictyobacter formicarum]